MEEVIRVEYPRPQFVRNEWINLNGSWDFCFDFGLSGEEREIYRQDSFEKKINVPFCPESKLSGLGHTDFINGCWYLKKVVLPEKWLQKGRRTHLNIDACDYEARVYVNDKFVGYHKGGYIGFSFDITEYLNSGENKIVVFAKDDVRSKRQPKGKQADLYYSNACDYTRTTGIWQTVWLENTPENYIKSVKLTPSLKNKTLLLEASVSGEQELFAEILFGGKSIAKKSAKSSFNTLKMVIDIPEIYEWNMETPNLYDLKLTFGSDEVASYFGLRDIEYKDNKTYLNGKSIFQRLILDQGFYPDGIYTAPSDEELVNDILRSKAMGYNGARLHQKVFEPRFLYHCDKLGYIVWGEHANWGMEHSGDIPYSAFLQEWLEIIERDYNHPAIIGWCPLNETPTNINRDFVRFLYHQTKSFDPTRIFIDNSGWFHVDGCYDMYDVHDYAQDPEKFRNEYMKLVEGKPVRHLSGLNNGGIGRHDTYDERSDISFVSEFGGIGWYLESGDSQWGYGNLPKSEEEWIERYKGLCDALLDNPKICAFCYTQLTDIEQEQNGLYTYDRRPKFPPEIIAAITSKKAAVEE